MTRSQLIDTLVLWTATEWSRDRSDDGIIAGLTAYLSPLLPVGLSILDIVPGADSIAILFAVPNGLRATMAFDRATGLVGKVTLEERPA